MRDIHNAATTFPPRWQGATAWLALAAITLAAVWLALDRVQNQRLFLVRLPFDREPLAAEMHDVSQAARTWKFPGKIPENRLVKPRPARKIEIGRASCRERV